jgi:aldehyde dehydrogenase (NAD+)
MLAQSRQTTDLDQFYRQCSALADQISANSDRIRAVLAPYETSEVIDHEIEYAIDALKDVSVEYDGFEHPQYKITAASFLPVNMPLYSLVLYGIIPSYYLEAIYIRPGMSLSSYIPKLVEILQLDKFGFEHLKIKDLPAKLFVDLYAKDAEIILFTGKYSNALMLERECSESMLIFEGSGPCPFFIFPDADIDLATDKAVAMRCFNSGQDCVAPDVIFVHESRADEFFNKLYAKLDSVVVGDTNDPKVRVSRMIKPKYLYNIQEWLEKNRQNVVYGGEIDTKQLIIKPTVLRRDIREHKGRFKELFSPIYYIITYREDQELIDIINEPSFDELSMYASVFGSSEAVINALSHSTILHNITVNDQENGNATYGGYGALANFTSYKGDRTAEPLLISRDIRNWMLAHQSRNFSQYATQVT